MATSQPVPGEQRRRLPEGADPRATNADSVTPVTPPRSAIPTTRDVLRAGLVTGFTSAVVVSMLALVAWLVGISFEVAPPFLDDVGFRTISAVSFVLAPLLTVLAASLAAAALLGVRRNQTWVWLAGTGGLLLSLGAPLAQPDGVPWSTRVILLLMQILTWAITVPQLARVVGDSDPAITANFRDESDSGSQ